MWMGRQDSVKSVTQSEQEVYMTLSEKKINILLQKKMKNVFMHLLCQQEKHKEYYFAWNFLPLWPVFSF